MADSLEALGVTHVAWESTGVLGKPVWNRLEGRFTLLLVNPAQIKQVPGRKSDVSDAEWSAPWLQCGLLRSSFVPRRARRQLRDLTRFRAQVAGAPTRLANRIHKVLEDATIKLSAVASDILGKSGRAMLRAVIRGEQDAETLAEIAQGVLRGTIPELKLALEGPVTAPHRFLGEHLLGHLDELERHEEELSGRIAEQFRPLLDDARVERLDALPGVNRTTIENVVAAIGVDMSVSPDEDHLIRFPVISCAPSDIWSIADSLDRLRVFADSTQTPDRLLLQLVVIPVRAVRPVMRTQVMPQVLHRIQLRRVRRQLDQAHIARHHQIQTGVEARPVPDQHRMHPGGQLPRELLQEQVHYLGVQCGHDQRRHRPCGGADGCQHVERGESRLPHRTRSRTPPRPDPRDRPLLAEAGFILKRGTNLLLGMRLGEGVDRLDDDLLEELLDLGVGLLVLGPGHQAAVVEAMQQVIDRLTAQGHAEFLLQDAAQVLAPEGADAVLGLGPGLEALLEPPHIRSRQAGRASGVGPLLEGRNAPLVVAGNPGLNGAATASQGLGDLGGGVALLGEDDGLVTEPDPFLGEGFGQSLKFFEGVMVLNKHRSSSWCDPEA